jgi:hypothetical protein
MLSMYFVIGRIGALIACARNEPLRYTVRNGSLVGISRPNMSSMIWYCCQATLYSVVVKNRAPLRNRGDGFIELGLYQLYQLKECFLARALRGYDIWMSMNYNNIRMPLDPDMRTRNFIQIIKCDVNYPRYGNKKGRPLHPGGKIVCHHLGSPL